LDNKAIYKAFRMNDEISVLMHIAAHIGTHVELASSLGLYIGYSLRRRIPETEIGAL
jgi:hypothetical protein